MTSEQTGRLIVYARSSGRCELCTRNASEWHHRQNRSQGGTWAPANGLHLCLWCHQFITEHPEHAAALGLTVQRGADPVTTPAYVHPCGFWRGWWLLDNHGCWTWDADRSMHPNPPPDVARAIFVLTAARLPL